MKRADEALLAGETDGGCYLLDRFGCAVQQIFRPITPHFVLEHLQRRSLLGELPVQGARRNVEVSGDAVGADDIRLTLACGVTDASGCDDGTSA